MLCWLDRHLARCRGVSLATKCGLLWNRLAAAGALVRLPRFEVSSGVMLSGAHRAVWGAFAGIIVFFRSLWSEVRPGHSTALVKARVTGPVMVLVFSGVTANVTRLSRTFGAAFVRPFCYELPWP